MDEGDVAVPVQASVIGPDPKLQGVRGWLLFFCVTLVLLNPLATLGIFAFSTWQLVPIYARMPGLLVVTIVDGVVSFALMSLAVYAGISLWRVRPGAVKLANTFLLAGVVYVLVAPLFIFLAGLPAGLAASTLLGSYSTAARSLLYYAIWFSYLRRSKRVQATYSQERPAMPGDFAGGNAAARPPAL
jgi:hypothetical protein